jgi:BirA family biotin operon repressor/biotin-[acetyl-CoA-carboxylase] ligase
MGLLADSPELLADLNWVEGTGSTNSDLLSDLTQKRAGDWSIRIATSQTQGRGRQGRSWETPNGSIAFSIAVPLNTFTPKITWLSAISAVAVSKALQPFTKLPITIKWPNDCLVAENKFAGILVELNSDYAVIGLGINFFASPSIPNTAHLQLTDYLNGLGSVIKSLYQEISQCSGLSNDEVKERISSQISTIGKDVLVELANGEKIVGMATGLMSSGALVVLTNSEQIEIHAGDVIHLRTTNASS